MDSKTICENETVADFPRPSERRGADKGETSQKFLRGEFVEVLSLTEILGTLDERGMLDGLPFMPEMARFCGRRFRVHRRAEKTCVEGLGVRLMGSTVFLEDVRCDGAAHDGCQRNCLIFWREAWLKPAAPGLNLITTPDYYDSENQGTEKPPILRDIPTMCGDRYVCQSTELATITRNLPRSNVAHFVTDWINGEVSIVVFIRQFSRMAINRLRRLAGFRAIGNLVGSEPSKSKGDLDLQSGDWVEVKSAQEISATLDRSGKNFGLTFEPDMLEYCGRRFQVDFPIRKIILEETGKMANLTRTVVLKNVNCQGHCAKNCPRSNPLYWREVWLKRE